MAYTKGFRLNLLQGDIFPIHGENLRVARFYCSIINKQLNLNLQNGNETKGYLTRLGIINNSNDTEVIKGLLIIKFTDMRQALWFADSMQALARIRREKFADRYSDDKIKGLVSESAKQKENYHRELSQGKLTTTAH